MLCSTKACCETLTDPILLRICPMFSSAMPSFRERRFSGSGTVKSFTCLSASDITILGTLFFIWGNVLHRQTLNYSPELLGDTQVQERSSCNLVTPALSCYRVHHVPSGNISRRRVSDVELHTQPWRELLVLCIGSVGLDTWTQHYRVKWFSAVCQMQHFHCTLNSGLLKFHAFKEKCEGAQVLPVPQIPDIFCEPSNSL